MQKGILRTSLENYQSEGESDSELAFCVIMEEMRKIGKEATDREIISKLNEIAGRITEYGSFNFLLSDGEKMYVYRKGNTLYYVERYPPYQEAIKSESKEVELLMKPVEEKAIVIATVPLTRNEKWNSLEENKITVFSYVNS
ncbi:MAG: class II glutamine amidotransferase [Candidatus Heimdallarchaeota archaeon]|nr:class II glutamine amidotransferase [Candidatus Heimdallarchaeota archaeon]